MTGPSGYARETKKLGCGFWPDEKPKNDHTGKKFGKLTVWQPVCKVPRATGGRVWVWLSLCECGGETLHINIGTTGSCGCAIGEGRRAHANRVRAEKGLPPIYADVNIKPKPKTVKHKPPPKPKPVKKASWRAHCNHGYYQCVRFGSCLGERVFKKVAYPSHYLPNGGCYTPSRDEIRLNAGVGAENR